MNETRGILVSLERRFQTFSQQQAIFVAALDRCRQMKFQPKEKVKTIAQVYNYAMHVTDNATDKRIFNMFLTLVRDLGEFRRTLLKLAKQKNDGQLNETFSIWKRVLDNRQDISDLRVRYPHTHLNHLSCDEARNHFGGIISVVPLAVTCAKDAVERIEVTRAYRHMPVFKGDCAEDRSRDKALPRRNAQEMRPRVVTERPTHYPSPFCREAQPPSPPISSPLSTTTPSEVSLGRSASSLDVIKADNAKKRMVRIRRPASASSLPHSTLARPPTPIRLRPQSGKATQTPNYLAATLKPALAWPHKTVSEAEMLKLLKRHKNLVVKPQWKP